MKTQLLCTFTTQHNLEQSIRDITKNFKIVFDKIYVLYQPPGMYRVRSFTGSSTLAPPRRSECATPN